MSSLLAPIGILGGTFDPIHFGHIHPAKQAMQQLNLRTLSLMPCHIPPHKTAQSSSQQRLAMIEHLCREEPSFVVDARELSRDAPSYSVQTLTQISSENSQRPICFLIGMDSLQNLHLWYQWQSLFELCHLVVCRRPGFNQALPEPVQNQVETRQTKIPNELHQSKSGHIYFAEVEPVDISSTQIRQKVQQGQSIAGLVPQMIEDYIYHHNLYN